MSVSAVSGCTSFFRCIFPCCYPSIKKEDEKVQSIQPIKRIVKYQQYIDDRSEPAEQVSPKRKVNKERRKKFQSDEIISIQQALHERTASRVPVTSPTQIQMGDQDV
jgi:hypothetical protein